MLDHYHKSYLHYAAYSEALIWLRLKAFYSQGSERGFKRKKKKGLRLSKGKRKICQLLSFKGNKAKFLKKEKIERNFIY